MADQQKTYLLNGNTSDAKAGSLSNLFIFDCDVSVVRKFKNGLRWKTVFWWNQKIADSTSKCIQARRALL